ncbi:MAG: hypothetical protein ACR2RB_14740 [Gammaproteobacteria bacterium]
MSRYGIHITLTENNPMRKPHLLGEDWEEFRWFESAAERDKAFAEMEASIGYYRKGDEPAQIVTRVDEVG